MWGALASYCTIEFRVQGFVGVLEKCWLFKVPFNFAEIVIIKLVFLGIR